MKAEQIRHARGRSDHMQKRGALLKKMRGTVPESGVVTSSYGLKYPSLQEYVAPARGQVSVGCGGSGRGGGGGTVRARGTALYEQWVDDAGESVADIADFDRRVPR